MSDRTASRGPQRDAAVDSLEADSLIQDESAEQVIAGKTPWQLARGRLYRDKITMTFLGIVALALLVGISAPILTKLGVLDPYTFHQDLIDPNTGGLPKGPAGGISLAHPLGVEPGTGRDVMSRLILGVTFSLVVATSATIIAVGLGTLLGLISGFLGHWPDFTITRLIDITLAFPQTLMLLALSGMLIDRITSFGVPAGNWSNGVYIILVLGLFGWPYIARIIRGQVLSLREREFIEAARSLGARNRRIYTKELIPNLWAPLLVYFTLLLPTYISAEAALSFLGVGIQPPTPTLGNILKYSVNYASADFTFFFFPALFIAVLVISFSLLGDGLRDAFDPKAER
ncbi:peptide/nickel transport system permease protein [Pedococcus cremeus]|uniref:Peptide/nickel transport system permease protein n=1 Tax=Pedococcus cremeus TaxID=587636 RepID=A0A1H9S1W6_9MICO|nr:ABC transporter permease [Pedococcus cremeus]SER78934.1 peptide/nickel transport system permease protein [Pedococcus cremeus]